MQVTTKATSNIPEQDGKDASSERDDRDDLLQIADLKLRSRLLLGTSGYPSPQIMMEAIVRASEKRLASS